MDRLDRSGYSAGDSAYNYFGLPSKRMRYSNPAKEETQPSVIKDKRVKVSKALRLETEMLEIHVGTEDQLEKFFVYEGVIVDRSPFFANAMKPEWAEKRKNSRVVELPDDDPAAFALYMQWMFTRRLPILPEDEESSCSFEEFATLSNAYVLGERLMDNDWKNVIADCYVQFARSSKPYYPSNEDIRIIYEGTREGSPIRQLLVDIYCSRGKADWLENDSHLPRDFLLQVTSALLKIRTVVQSVSRPWKNSHEQYHDT
ncbi:hypothetical protein CC78DRAFT_536017 [Lojkania enalia]|uniref:BTB domain-containing protein n=1 Tax=Lojkania enalia TaxID=147567 RepID=A0A9P4MX60_9PLEO|nr:hypothetical protein CC78DRAFT_536017 [Didymosphaeria enalia]